MSEWGVYLPNEVYLFRGRCRFLLHKYIFGSLSSPRDMCLYWGRCVFTEGWVFFYWGMGVFTEGGVSLLWEGCFLLRDGCFYWRRCVFTEGDVSLLRVVRLYWGRCVFTEGDVLLLREVCLYWGRCVFTEGGVSLLKERCLYRWWCVFTEVCVGGVSLLKEVCLYWGRCVFLSKVYVSWEMWVFDGSAHLLNEVCYFKGGAFLTEPIKTLPTTTQGAKIISHMDNILDSVTCILNSTNKGTSGHKRSPAHGTGDGRHINLWSKFGKHITHFEGGFEPESSQMFQSHLLRVVAPQQHQILWGPQSMRS